MVQSNTLGIQPGGSGFSVRTGFNEAIQALATNSAGENQPGQVYPGMYWYKPSAKILYKRDDSNTSWLIEANFGAASAPTVNDDSTLGYHAGSMWVANGNSVYFCRDPQSLSASWIELSAFSGGVSSFNSRVGSVAPVTGDYNADMITETATKVVMLLSERQKLQGIAAGAQANPATITQSEARKATVSSTRSFSPVLARSLAFGEILRTSTKVPFRSFFLPSYTTSSFAHGSNGTELDALATQIPSCNTVTATVHVFSSGATSNTVARDGTLSEVPGNLGSWFSTAKNKGFKVGLCVILHTDTSYGWAGNWNPASPSTAFANYYTAIQPYITQAETAGADFLVLCDEWSTMFRESAAVSAFQTLFTSARNDFSGLIGIHSNVLEESDVLSGITDLCDFVGINAYLQLTTVNSPPVVDMVSNLMRASTISSINTFISGKASAWNRSDNIKGYLQYLRYLAGTWGKPIMLTTGYKSTTGGAINPAGQAETSADNGIQENAYRAFIEASMSVLGDELLGFNFWRWWPLTTTDTTGYSPKGKPAAAAIHNAWSFKTNSFWQSGDIILGSSGGGGGATTLDGLGDVVISSPALNQILKYDGTQWVNANNTGTAATWPPANWPSTGTTQLFWGGNYGISPANVGTVNLTGINNLFTAVTASSYPRKKVVIPGGPIQVYGTFSPSGTAAGLGSSPGEKLEIYFDNTQLIAASSSTADYAEIQSHNGSSFVNLNTVAVAAGDSPVGWGVNPETTTGTYILDASGNGVRKWVFFNLRNLYEARLTGTLELKVSGARIANLAAMGSSGGGVGGNYAFKRGFINDLTITNFEIGIYAATWNGNNQQVDTFTSAAIGKLLFYGGRAFIVDANKFDGLSIGGCTLICDSTSYIFSSQAISIGSGFIVASGPAGSGKKIIEIAKSTLNINAFYARSNQLNAGHSAINNGNKSSINIGVVHCDTSASHVFTSGGIIAAHKSDSGNNSLEGAIRVLGGDFMETGPTGATVSLQADTAHANAKRTIFVQSSDGATATWKSVIPKKETAASWATTTNDRIMILDQLGWRQVRCANGNLVSW